ncbi:hypothetical protein KEJ50_04500 [Candidatus Bathyarchaeota archaeon]|nr:hypothetical protein [Candidatus Bathyarchaeota archaeon]
MCRLAKLSEEELKLIQKLEAKLKRIVLIAYEKPSEIAELTNKQLEKIKDLEKQLNVKLVAYK